MRLLEDQIEVHVSPVLDKHGRLSITAAFPWEPIHQILEQNALSRGQMELLFEGPIRDAIRAALSSLPK